MLLCAYCTKKTCKMLVSRITKSNNTGMKPTHKNQVMWINLVNTSVLSHAIHFESWCSHADTLISNVGRLVMALYLAADPLEPSRFFTHLWILLLQSGQILQVPVVWDGRWHKSEKRNQSEMTSWKITHESGKISYRNLNIYKKIVSFPIWKYFEVSITMAIRW